MARKNNLWKIILTIVLTAIVVGGINYYLQNQDKAGQMSIITETSQPTFTLSIDQESSGSSVVKLRDTYNENAGFSLKFPASWSLVNVKKQNLTDSGGHVDELPQRASYTFTSELRPHTHYFTVIISYAKDKADPLVTQNDRIYITEDENYYYNYNPSTQFCLEQGKCKENELEEINAEIQEIIDTFELLK